MNSNAPSLPSFSGAQRVRVGTQVLVALLAGLAIVGMANYLAARHYHRFQWTSDARFDLSRTTRQVLGAVTNEMSVILLFDRDHPLFPSVYGLLSEYAYACPRLKLEHLNYRRDPGRAELLAARLQLASSETDLVVFEAGNRFKIVRAAELSDYDVASLLAGEREVRRVAFKGEPLFTHAIAALLDTQSPVACFLRGHGEHDPASDEKLLGYSRFAGLLRQKGIEVQTLELLGNTEVPEACRLLVIAGPRSPLDPLELERLTRYVQRGGRVLALLSFHQAQRERTGLEDWLQGWGVTVGDNFVFDPDQSIRGNDLVVSNYSAHAITAPLRDRRLHLVLARSMMARTSPGPGAAGGRVQPLFFTSVGGTPPAPSPPAGSPTFPRSRCARRRPARCGRRTRQHPGARRRPRGRPPGRRRRIALPRQRDDSQRRQPRVRQPGCELAAGSPQDLAGLAARPLHEYRITLTRTAMIQLRWLLLLVLPGALLAVGGVVWWRRRY
ncbi:MAG: GldG family protein [Verrucomicrobia bacterium]|nr:GldG family protein [Verrucomicrobiota bacterium]